MGLAVIHLKVYNLICHNDKIISFFVLFFFILLFYGLNNFQQLIIKDLDPKLRELLN